MKKLLTILVVALFAISGGVLVGLQPTDTATVSPAGSGAAETSDSDITTREETFHFSAPTVDSTGHYATIHTGDGTTLTVSGEPMLPYRTRTMTLPLGTDNIRVDVQPGATHEMQVPKTIAPAPTAVTANMKQADPMQRESSVYDSSDAYPGTWGDWHVGVGRNSDGRTLFLTLRLYPAQYTPAENTVTYTDTLHVDISYKAPEEQTAPAGADTYDMVIIAPGEFTDALQPLVQHKQDNGISTQHATLTEIYNGAYFSAQGANKPEQVKYFIKDALDNWGIKYVMLVGGRNGGLMQEKWWCPVRYAHLDDQSNWETSYLSDLYFADIYKYEEGEEVFATWDSNDNGIYAEWSGFKKDELDCYPDVFVGRLACRNSYEVEKMVEKIISYETTTAGSDWFKRFVGVAGDTFPAQSDPYIDGEVTVTKSAGFVEDAGFDVTKLYTSDGTLSGPEDVVNAISEGCGLLSFEGHGNPMGWATHPPKEEDTWIDGLRLQDMMKLSNDGEYPVCVVGGCHNSQFNVSVLNLLKIYEGYSQWQEYLYKGEIPPECWSWWLTRGFGKGSIATIGSTGLGYGAIGDNNGDGIPDATQFYGGFIDSEFFKIYSNNTDLTLGEVHGTALRHYVNKFPPMQNKIDAKTVEEWVLLGDPSLHIGGYQ
jgi:hypothetical protein